MLPDWEIWLDNNLSPVIAKWLKDYTGWDVRSFYTLDFPPTTKDDEVYWRAREKGNVILISKDTDFPNLINRLGSPPKLVSIQIGNTDNRVLWNFETTYQRGYLNFENIRCTNN
ncbi:MAG: DUF5615 family PIN-like protein [Bacteroidetes bacterium]|nr:DUF5615 family PIN-like protein [Bacteroidota bacterium]